jgi:maltooligosyltrehalose trehalohydrolase
MLFQGQEFASSAPFLYFADNTDDPERAGQINAGRAEFLAQFPSIAASEVSSRLPDSSDPANFERCKLDFAERESHAEVYALHRELLRLRRQDPVFRTCARDAMHGATLAERALLLRFFSEHGDRLLICNLGDDLELRPGAEPLLAPPQNCEWSTLFSSDDPRYGGRGAGKVLEQGIWKLPARSTQIYAATIATAEKPEEKA